MSKMKNDNSRDAIATKLLSQVCVQLEAYTVFDKIKHRVEGLDKWWSEYKRHKKKKFPLHLLQYVICNSRLMICSERLMH